MQTQSNKIDFNGQNIYAGFDVHLKSWRVTIMTEKLTHKTFTQPPKPELLHAYLVKLFQVEPIILPTKQDWDSIKIARSLRNGDLKPIHVTTGVPAMPARRLHGSSFSTTAAPTTGSKAV